MKNVVFWKNSHARVRKFSWNSNLIFMRIFAYKRALKTVFVPGFWAHTFLRFECSFTGRIFQKKTSQNFMKIPWLKHVTFFKKPHFSKIRLREIYKVVITKHPYFTLFRTLDLEKNSARCDEKRPYFTFFWSLDLQELQGEKEATYYKSGIIVKSVAR